MTFEASPDYEAPADSGRNNVYNVTVEVTDSAGNTATRAVTVTVTNMDEDGEVTLSNLQPEDGVEITAELDDPDGRISNLTWQWATTSGQQNQFLKKKMMRSTAPRRQPTSRSRTKWLWAISCGP